MLKRLWIKAVGEIPDDWNADDPGQKIGNSALWILSIICMYGIIVAEFYSLSGNPLVIACWRFLMHACIPLCAVAILICKERGKDLWMPVVGLLVATIPFIYRLEFLKRKEAGVFFEAHFYLIWVPLVVSLVLAGLACYRNGLVPKQWGLWVGDWRWWLPRFGIVLALLIPTLVVILHVDGALATYYPIWRPARKSLESLMLSNASYGIDMLSWEMLFRGIILFGYARRGDPHTAIWAQTIPFFFLHASKPTSELIGSLFGGLISGWFCLRSRSFWPLFLLHWIQLITVNSVSYWIRAAV